MRSSLLLLAALSFLALPVSSHAARDFPAPRVADILAALGDTSVPPEWGGVWHFEDTEYDCVSGDSLSSDSEDVTLCTGEEVYPNPGATCSGTTDGTSISITCTGSGGFPPICTVDVTFTLTADRSGETLTATSTYTQVSTPADCFGQDGCTRTETIGTRSAPEPTPCTSPVESNAWGKVKSRYR